MEKDKKKAIPSLIDDLQEAIRQYSDGAITLQELQSNLIAFLESTWMDAFIEYKTNYLESIIANLKEQIKDLQRKEITNHV